MKKTLALIAPLALLGACSSAMEAVRGPELAPIGYPAALVPVNQQYLEPPAQAASANSLWRTGARSFFGDQRARHVGDILTVNIDIDDRAQVQNSTARSRNNEINSGVTNLFGLEAVLPNGNMVIQGRQEVRTNREVRELTVAGIVRPEDISSANTIAHTQIAEARISYGGRGDVSRVQAPPAAQALAERFNPF